MIDSKRATYKVMYDITTKYLSLSPWIQLRPQVPRNGNTILLKYLVNDFYNA